MAVPTRSEQIKVIEALLDSDDAEGKTLNQIATHIVDSYHDLLSGSLKAAPPPPVVGMAFKSPITGKVHHVAWMRDDLVWLVSAGTRYGSISKTSDEFWQHIESTNAKAGAPGNNPDWNVGDEVTLSQRRKTYRVVATHDKCVLLLDVKDGSVQADSNDNLTKFYRKAS
jgi:hypothetical protein